MGEHKRPIPANKPPAPPMPPPLKPRTSVIQNSPECLFRQLIVINDNRSYTVEINKE